MPPTPDTGTHRTTNPPQSLGLPAVGPGRESPVPARSAPRPEPDPAPPTRSSGHVGSCATHRPAGPLDTRPATAPPNEPRGTARAPPAHSPPSTPLAPARRPAARSPAAPRRDAPFRPPAPPPPLRVPSH